MIKLDRYIFKKFGNNLKIEKPFVNSSDVPDIVSTVARQKTIKQIRDDRKE